MPENHYHFCHSNESCDFNCRLCGSLVRKWGHLPIAEFQYGCCHRCQEYKTCTDFVERNIEQSKALGLWEE